GAAGVVVVQMRHHHEIDVADLQAQRVEPMDQQVLVGEARVGIVAHQAGHRAGGHAGVEEHVAVGGLDQPARDRDLRDLLGVLTVEEERALGAHETVLQRVERLDRHDAGILARARYAAPAGWRRMPAMDFALTEQQELIRKEVSALARSFPPEYWLEKDNRAEYPFEFVKAFAQAGWL